MTDDNETPEEKLAIDRMMERARRLGNENPRREYMRNLYRTAPPFLKEALEEADEPPKMSMGCNVENPRCAICNTPWNQLCAHNPVPTAADHAKFANPMTHFMYLSFGSSPMGPADPGPKKEDDDE